MPAVRIATVESYDPVRGLGVVVDEEGARHGFHCTAIAGGGREIAEGTRVALVLEAGHLGALEARDVTPIGLPVTERGAPRRS